MGVKCILRFLNLILYFFQKGICKIKTAIQSAKVSNLSDKVQDELLRQIALSLIWNEKFNMEKQIVQKKLKELEFNKENKEEFELLIGHYEQVFVMD